MVMGIATRTAIAQTNVEVVVRAERNLSAIVISMGLIDDEQRLLSIFVDDACCHRVA